MKIFNISVDDFNELLNQCKGRVDIITEDGDRIVTQSLLSSLVGYSHLIHVASMKEIEFECELPEDKNRIVNYLMNNIDSTDPCKCDTKD